MKFKEYLSEALSRTIPNFTGFKVGRSGNKVATLQFQTMISTQKTKEEKKSPHIYEFIAYPQGKNMEVIFSINDEYELKKLDDPELTNKAYAYTIDLIQKAVEESPLVQTIFFTADIREKSRVRFYHTFSKLVSKRLNGNIDYRAAPSMREMHYYINIVSRQ